MRRTLIGYYYVLSNEASNKSNRNRPNRRNSTSRTQACYRFRFSCVPRVVIYTPLQHAGVAEWQTRMVQVHVSFGSWRFKSSHPHHRSQRRPPPDAEGAVLLRLRACHSGLPRSVRPQRNSGTNTSMACATHAALEGADVDPYSPIKGKCTWWREVAVDEDVHDIMVKPEAKRVRCTCFVEGYSWTQTRADVPRECPESDHCRYYIVAG